MTVDKFEHSLHAASSCGAKHISVYDLQVEEKTAFSRWYTPGAFPLPTEVQAAEMYRSAVRVLSDRGFDHYEVSNYALSGYRSRHNMKYWSCEPVWGFGMAAASFVNGERDVRPSNMEGYTKFVQDIQLKCAALTKTSLKQQAVVIPDVFEFLMLALRTKSGLNLFKFDELYGSAFKSGV